MGCKNIDIKNKKYGKLTAIKYAGKDNNNRSTWYFLCDCGNNVIKRKSRVLDGATLSCGCKRIKKDEDGNLKSLYVRYKKESIKRGYEFSLTNKEFFDIKKQNCHYCGAIPKKYNGIDRKDNKIGYVYSNCLPCCIDCNFAKRTLEYDYFLNWINKIKSHTIK